MENPFRRISNEQLAFVDREFRLGIFKQLEDGVPMPIVEDNIAERNYKQPCKIIGDLYLYPFWRDGKETPPLPTIYPHRGH